MVENATNVTRSGPSELQINRYVEIVKGQTDMSEEEILESLKLHDYDIVKVVRSYFKGGKIDDEREKCNTVYNSKNQLRFNEIRNFMDKAAESFRRNQEMNRIYQQVMEKKKAQEAAAAAAAAAPAPAPATPEGQKSKL